MNTPILFLVFNRPDETMEVFNVIKSIKPKKLFVAGDGPRKNFKNDYYLCEKVRSIFNNIDWECEVVKKFNKENLGCKVAVSESINWFFSKVDEGIIIEDDCLPSKSFFYFCNELLKKYKNNKEVMMICGHNPLGVNKEISQDYFFGKYYSIWGWATWKRSWEKYDIEMKDWDKQNKREFLKRTFPNNFFIIENIKTDMDKTKKNKINTWDIQWVYSCVKNNGLSIIPKYNLISNIGSTGTHNMDKNNLFRKKYEVVNVQNMCHPQKIYFNKKQNSLIYKKQKKVIPFIKKVILKIFFK